MTSINMALFTVLYSIYDFICFRMVSKQTGQYDVYIYNLIEKLLVLISMTTKMISITQIYEWLTMKLIIVW